MVRDGETKTKLAEALRPRNPATSAIKEAPIIIIACAELGRSGFYKGVSTTKKGDWYMFDVALAMQNLILAAHSLDLGTIHVADMDADKIAEILGVPEGVTVVEMTPLGYPDDEPKAPPRKELSELVFYEKYGQNPSQKATPGM